MAHQSAAHPALYAIGPDEAGGRRHVEPDDPLRSPFELDRHRIIESTAFRRLEGKTQVFLATHHDHFRTRLTHTLEAAEIARTLAVKLRVSEHLTEAITLAHDLGHPPFGHAGEVALNEAMAGYGGFNHNAHSLRVVAYLEHPFPGFRGLNLTAATRDGLATHGTRYDKPASVGHGGPRADTGPSVEAQIASVADRIAYDCHDLEDAIGAGFVTLSDLEDVTLWKDALADGGPRLRGLPIHAVRRAVLDILLNRVLTDVLATSKTRLASIASAPSRGLPTGESEKGFPHESLVTPSAAVASQLVQLEEFLVEHLYRRREVVDMDARGKQMVRTLFSAFRDNPDALPERFAARVPDQGPHRVICDYLAGMTDRFCRALFDEGVAHG